ncbi:MAG TPA: peptidoglycan DD-metalloendopeptidase family protein [Methylophilaceae bacterium]|nr:peptidoglycan DD-metalloendopeptidase family protein [Methylophilaceae bacterium]
MQQGKSGILAQNPIAQERKLRLRWLLGVSSIPLFGIITAFGIAPQTADQNIPVATVVENISLPAQSAAIDTAIPMNHSYWQADQVRKDDTLGSLLERLNIRNNDAIDFLRHASEARGLASQLRPGRNILAKTSEDGTLHELHYQLSADTSMSVKLIDGVYQAEQNQIALENRTQMGSAEIHSSLFAATDDAGIPDSVAMQLVEIFSSDIDFHLDLRKGDHFSVVYEGSYNNGELVKAGRVLAAEFINDGNTYQAVLYQGEDGQSNYYTPNGKSLHKAFLRSPLEFSRISSGFSLARFHPVLQKFRAHKGVDYAAPTGTGVKATADGTVAFVGTQGGYGNVIMLQHQGGATTVYGHLSRFAPGLRNGQKIAQGEIIGQVGMSGMATGPHLHYEFRVNGVHRDPLKVALPNVPPIAAHNLAAFQQQAQPRLSQLALLRGALTASLD